MLMLIQFDTDNSDHIHVGLDMAQVQLITTIFIFTTIS